MIPCEQDFSGSGKSPVGRSGEALWTTQRAETTHILVTHHLPLIQTLSAQLQGSLGWCSPQLELIDIILGRAFTLASAISWRINMPCKAMMLHVFWGMLLPMVFLNRAEHHNYFIHSSPLSPAVFYPSEHWVGGRKTHVGGPPYD